MTNDHIYLLTMTTDMYGIGQKEKTVCNDFSDEAIQINAVKDDPCEIDIFTGIYYNRSVSETDFVAHKHVTDSYQEQNEEKLDAKNPNQEDSDDSKFSDYISRCDEVEIKNEDDIDIFHEDIKSETGEEKPTQGFGFCKVCYQNFVVETDIFKSTSYRFECSENQNESPFYNISGEDMTHDVKRTSPVLSTVSRLKPPKTQNESISEDEVTKEQDSATVSRRLSVPSNKIDYKIERKSCSTPLENNRVKYQTKDIAEKKFHCKTCSKSFSQGCALKDHERSHTGERPFHCKICSKSFTQASSLKLHERCHTGEKPFQCKVCLKYFTQKISLKRHDRSHTGEKPFHCKICLKSFTQSSSLKVHERGHTSGKRSFSQTSSLKVHESGHTSEKRFHCKICSKSFSLSNNLKRHEMIHTGVRPFHCKICSKSFPQRSSLKVHERCHTGEKPFQCKVCLNYFTQKISLKCHERSHTGEKPFQCNVCSKAFTSSAGLARHRKIHIRRKQFH